ncbi:MAG: hypothetical protein M4579_001748 [Chaenotheca gracillima]|nr:MAG: hypothetical protein M4579_001748 [Chaenotheca gracillima]
MATSAENSQGVVAAEPSASINLEQYDEKSPHSGIPGAADLEEHSIPYSSFSPRQKSCISYAASFSAMFSGLSSFIYYPAITALSRSLRVSVELINLTITFYQIVSGVAPSILGDLADHTGRRPVTLFAFVIYLAANLGLAVQDSYTALALLRCLQSVAASGTIAIAYGIISDIATPAERGSYVGILMGFTNSAPSLGPVLGGILAEKLSWRWIFWVLSIISGLHLLCLVLFLPETSRKLVGDGSLSPARAVNRSVYSLLRSHRSNKTQELQLGAKPRLRFPNPLTCIVALFQKGTFIILLVGGIQYTVYGCLAASLSTQMIDIYHLTYLTGGLAYLPCGLGGMIAAYSTGKLLDYDYRVYARRHHFPESKSAAHDLFEFPLEMARLRSIYVFLSLSTVATAGFGWSLEARTHIAVPLVLQFFTGSTQVAIFTICGTLLTDLNPGRSATVQASYNLVRCALSAAGIAALQALIDRVGVGWCFTMYAIIGALCAPMCLALRQWGWGWRKRQIERAKQRTDCDDGQERPKESRFSKWLRTTQRD